jgi:hypothetical protein
VPNLQLLNPQSHGQLRLRPVHEAAPHFVQVLAPEFQVAATCCPILFTKDAETGAFYAGAMFGFKPGENLLGSPEERGGFLPLMLQREGFFMSERNIAIDRDHARFSEHEGEPLFNEAHEPGDSLRAIQRTLGEIHHGLERTRAFIAELTALKLIEPIDVSLIFDKSERLTLQGLYTVSLDRLRDVDDAAALRLFRAGHLQLGYSMVASLKHIPRLAQLRERLQAARGHSRQV